MEPPNNLVSANQASSWMVGYPETGHKWACGKCKRMFSDRTRKLRSESSPVCQLCAGIHPAIPRSDRTILLTVGHLKSLGLLWFDLRLVRLRCATWSSKNCPVTNDVRRAAKLLDPTYADYFKN